jgi:hypothetical protein
MAVKDQERIGQNPHTETKPYLRNAAIPRRVERASHINWWRPDLLAGAGGLEPPNGGIKNRPDILIEQSFFPD